MSDTGSLFLPSPEAAKAVDTKVRERLIGSFPWLARTFDDLDIDAATLAGWHARPVDFGFYYDLASAVHHADDANPTDVSRTTAQQLADRIRAYDPSVKAADGLALTNLTSEDFTDVEIDCLLRWFDLEPDNRMALIPLDDAELASSKAMVQQCLAFLEAAAPAFYGELQFLTKQFIFAKPGAGAKLSFGGASSFALWGAVALNGPAHDSWWDYVVRIVHEYSHNMLFGVASDEQLVLNDPSERYKSPLRVEPRPVDGIYHACYVSARNVVLMDMLRLAAPDVETDMEWETLQALIDESSEFTERSYRDCMDVLNTHGKMTDLGQAILDEAAEYMKSRA